MHYICLVIVSVSTLQCIFINFENLVMNRISFYLCISRTSTLISSLVRRKQVFVCGLEAIIIEQEKLIFKKGIKISRPL